LSHIETNSHLGRGNKVRHYWNSCKVWTADAREQMIP